MEHQGFKTHTHTHTQTGIENSNLFKEVGLGNDFLTTQGGSVSVK